MLEWDVYQANIEQDTAIQNNVDMYIETPGSV